MVHVILMLVAMRPPWIRGLILILDTYAELVMLPTYIDAVLLLIYADHCIDYLPKTYSNDYLPILLGHLLLILI